MAHWRKIVKFYVWIVYKPLSFGRKMASLVIFPILRSANIDAHNFIVQSVDFAIELEKLSNSTFQLVDIHRWHIANRFGRGRWNVADFREFLIDLIEKYNEHCYDVRVELECGCSILFGSLNQWVLPSANECDQVMTCREERCANVTNWILKIVEWTEFQSKLLTVSIWHSTLTNWRMQEAIPNDLRRFDSIGIRVDLKCTGNSECINDSQSIFHSTWRNSIQNRETAFFFKCFDKRFEQSVHGSLAFVTCKHK